MKGKLSFFVRPDEIRVVNPEPDSVYDQYHYLNKFRVIAEDEDGDREIHFKFFDDEHEAARFAAKVARAYAQGRKLSPERWYPIEPCYGSKAYQRDEPFIVERERREELQG